MSQKFLFSLADRKRDKRNNTELGISLALTAGMINAGGFLAIGAYTSHMTGIVSSIGDFLALHKFNLAGLSLLYVFCFFSGAAICSMMIVFARDRHWRGEISYPLMLEATLLAVFALTTPETPVVIGILCFMMGLQNAIITKVSHAEIRTTHVTGLVTDIGIETGRYISKRFFRETGAEFHPDKLRLYLSLFFAFAFGSVIGAFAFLHSGNVIALIPAVVLAVIATAPMVREINKRP